MLWMAERCPSFTRRDAEKRREAMLDWHRSKGERKVDWYATLRNWVARDYDKLVASGELNQSKNGRVQDRASAIVARVRGER